MAKQTPTIPEPTEWDGPEWLKRWSICIDLSLRVLESIAIIIWMAVSFYLIIHLIVTEDLQSDRIFCSLKIVAENWKVTILLGIPLFYRPIRKVIENIKKLGPVETEEREKKRGIPTQGEKENQATFPTKTD